MKLCHWMPGGRSKMPRFDVYRNSGAHAVTPYLLDVQSDLLQGLETPKLAAVPLRLLKTKVATLAASRV